MSWRSDAACLDADPETFFLLGRGGSYSDARKVCSSCLVAADCLADGIDEPFGMWGGMTPDERRELRDSSAKCGTRSHYRAGCREPGCVAANTAYAADTRRSAAQRRSAARQSRHPASPPQPPRRRMTLPVLPIRLRSCESCVDDAGLPCWWVAEDLCSACAEEMP